jgi:hypothetical protein
MASHHFPTSILSPLLSLASLHPRSFSDLSRNSSVVRPECGVVYQPLRDLHFHEGTQLTAPATTTTLRADADLAACPDFVRIGVYQPTMLLSEVCLGFTPGG